MERVGARFFCDDHLRRLARWLRAAGFDVAWEPAIDDRELLERCRSEHRVLLTLDRGLLERREAKGVGCLLPSHDPIEQLRFVRDNFRLDLLGEAFTRCPVCNMPLQDATAEEANAPRRVREWCDRYWVCPGCTRGYWQGDHVAHMRERFERI
jgi:uncharacterized protein with PIN domain